MKEIKFRAWDKTGRFMMYDVYMNRVNIDLVPFKSHQEGPVFTVNLLHPDITVMQYTSLKDKQGVGIYEGDVVKHLVTSVPQDSFATKEVIFDAGSFKVWDKKSAPTPLGWISPKCLEVIGNIHENPEHLP